jgi:signal transduction histidine kinase
VTGQARPLPEAVDLTAYRVIQESLTNVYKHSLRRRAQLTLGYHRRELRITIDDLGLGGPPGAGAVPEPATDPPTGGGQGIRGMRERLLALGGLLTAGPRPGGGFRVDATLPYQPAGLSQPLGLPTGLDGAERPAVPAMETQP